MTGSSPTPSWSSSSPRRVLPAAVVVVLLVATARTQRPEQCTTPQSVPGTCVVLRSCPTLYGLLQGSRPLSYEVVLFLQRSQCGFQGRDPKVCCPLTDSSVPSRPTGPTSGSIGGSTRPPPRPRPPTSRPPTTPPRPRPPATTGSPARPDQYTEEEPQPVNVAREPNLRLLPLDVCGPSSTNRIINGNKTTVFEFPWMARLGYRSSREIVDTRISDAEHTGEGLIDPRSGNGNIAYRCGGSLINARYVLTAAHCVEGLKSTETLATIRLGEHDVTTDIDCSIIVGERVCAPPAYDVGVEETVSHPGFSLEGPNRLQNDVALVRLDRRVTFSDSVKPICLPVGNEQFKELDKKVTVAGWGTTETGYSSNELLQVNVPVVKGPQCVNVYKSMLRISPSRQLCAGGTREGDSCNGDSGGPLQFSGNIVSGDVRTLQFGIVSFGPRKCGSEGMPGVYTRVGFYMQWILRNIRP